MEDRSYSLRELFDDLPCTIMELSRQSGVNEVTIARIRDGKPARRATINKLLLAMSRIYGVRLNTRNVTGIHLQGKDSSEDAA